MLEKILRFIERFIPKKLYRMGQPAYHYLLAIAGAIIYWFPSRKIHVVGVTGTKGKSTTVELVNAILEEAGFTTAILSTIRFKVADKETRNMRKMTIPGRFFVQRLLRDAVTAKCDWVILEMTSEGAKQFRQKYIHFDAFIFTNLSPEHIESHGSFEKYRDAKRSLGYALEHSSKKNQVIVSNADDDEGAWYLKLNVPRTFPYSLANAQPFEKTKDGFQWTFKKYIDTFTPSRSV